MHPLLLPGVHVPGSTSLRTWPSHSPLLLCRRMAGLDRSTPISSLDTGSQLLATDPGGIRSHCRAGRADRLLGGHLQLIHNPPRSPHRDRHLDSRSLRRHRTSRVLPSARPAYSLRPPLPEVGVDRSTRGISSHASGGGSPRPTGGNDSTHQAGNIRGTLPSREGRGPLHLWHPGHGESDRASEARHPQLAELPAYRLLGRGGDRSGSSAAGGPPPMQLTFQSYHLMVGLGFYFIALAAAGLYLLYRRRLEQTSWYLRLLTYSAPLPILASELGWVAAEVGRQPWIVQGELRTVDAVSASVPAGQIGITLAIFILIYALLFVAWIRIVSYLIARGPTTAAHVAEGDKT